MAARSLPRLRPPRKAKRLQSLEGRPRCDPRQRPEQADRFGCTQRGAESAVTVEAVLRSGVGRKSVGELVVVVEVLDADLDDAVGAQRVGFANERTLLVESVARRPIPA